MPDFFIAMNYQGTLLEARKMNDIGVTAINRAPDIVTAIRMLDDVRAYDLLRKETIS